MGNKGLKSLAFYGAVDDIMSTSSWEALIQALEAHEIKAQMVQRKSRRGLWPRAEDRWVAGSEWEGPRHGTLLLAPSDEELLRVHQRWPHLPVVVGESLSLEVKSVPNVISVPRIVSEIYFPAANLSDVFGVTAKYHLEARPRILYGGGYTNGATLTKLLTAASRILSHGGELVLLDSLMVRSSWAPVVRRLGLSENVVFVGDLSEGELAGLVMGADALWVLDTVSIARSFLSAVLATGTPIVAQYSEALNAVLGHAALWVYEDDLELWIEAATRALVSEPLREELSRRAMSVAQAWHQTLAVEAWLTAITDRGSV